MSVFIVILFIMRHLSTTILLILMINCKNHSEHDDFDCWLIMMFFCCWQSFSEALSSFVCCSVTITEWKTIQRWLIIDKMNVVHFMIIDWLIQFISLLKLKNGIFDYFSNEMQLFFTNKFVFLSKKREKNVFLFFIKKNRKWKKGKRQELSMKIS